MSAPVNCPSPALPLSTSAAAAVALAAAEAAVGGGDDVAETDSMMTNFAARSVPSGDLASDHNKRTSVIYRNKCSNEWRQKFTMKTSSSLASEFMCRRAGVSDDNPVADERQGKQRPLDLQLSVEPVAADGRTTPTPADEGVAADGGEGGGVGVKEAGTYRCEIRARLRKR